MIIKTAKAEFDSAAIFSPIDVFTRKAEIDRFINTSVVYVADDWSGILESIENDYTNRLANVSTNPKEVAPFITDDGGEWTFCLPVSAVKFKAVEPKKEYRPFNTRAELINALHVDFGGFITWRYKEHPEPMYKEMVTGMILHDEKLTNICLADCYWDIKKLFDKVEYLGADAEWHPFGIEVTKEQGND